MARAQSLRLDGCSAGWQATEGLVFGIAPQVTHRVTVAFPEQKKYGFEVTRQVVTPPGAPRLRVFAVAIGNADSAAVIAQGSDGSALPRDAQDPHNFPLDRNAC